MLDLQFLLVSQNVNFVSRLKLFCSKFLLFNRNFQLFIPDIQLFICWIQLCLIILFCFFFQHLDSVLKILTSSIWSLNFDLFIFFWLNNVDIASKHFNSYDFNFCVIIYTFCLKIFVLHLNNFDILFQNFNLMCLRKEKSQQSQVLIHIFSTCGNELPHITHMHWM